MQFSEAAAITTGSTAGRGRDQLIGGAGNDVLSAADGAPDVIDCVPGHDKATVDRLDQVKRRCEVVAYA
jgi:Ca2+-binding RTX toxin-like protein